MNSQQGDTMKESNDILTLFESLNSHEVFTPPRLARQMLSQLPENIWSEPSLKILDPCTKSGVFLRESMYLLFNGLLGKGKHVGSDGETYDLSDPKQLMKHILKNMLFGVATSELTGYVSRRTLYGVMEANTDKQTALIDAFEKSKNNHEWSDEEKVNFLIRNRFNDYYDHTMFNSRANIGYEHEGNIFYPREEVQRKVVEDGDYEIEDTFYPFIEENIEHAKIQKIRSGEMKFDVIIGNPPYQVNTSVHSKQAKPIYHLFIEQAIEMSPRYISMITPSRWFTGGMGLTNFRKAMISDRRVQSIYDFPNSKDCFPGVSISGGVNYFLWNKNHKGACHFTSCTPKGSETFETTLDQFPIVVRYKEAKQIIDSITKSAFPTVSSYVQPINVFNLSSSFRGQSTPKTPTDIKVTHSKGIGYASRDEVKDDLGLVDKFKVVVSRTVAEHANEPNKDGTFKVLSKVLLLPPGEACTHSYLVVGAFNDLNSAEIFKSALYTRTARYLILQTLTGIDLSRERFCFVPFINTGELMEDEIMYSALNLSKENIEVIENLIRPMEV